MVASFILVIDTKLPVVGEVPQLKNRPLVRLLCSYSLKGGCGFHGVPDSTNACDPSCALMRYLQ
jgi:hypothetical protein